MFLTPLQKNTMNMTTNKVQLISLGLRIDKLEDELEDMEANEASAGAIGLKKSIISNLKAKYEDKQAEINASALHNYIETHYDLIREKVIVDKMSELTEEEHEQTDEEDIFISDYEIVNKAQMIMEN